MTAKQLQSRTTYWQERLNLREWTITVGWGSAEEMKRLHGCCWWSSEELTATIKLSKRVKDKEGTLVHELLHIVLQGHGDLTGPHDTHLERAINRIAAALTQEQQAQSYE